MSFTIPGLPLLRRMGHLSLFKYCFHTLSQTRDKKTIHPVKKPGHFLKQSEFSTPNNIVDIPPKNKRMFCRSSIIWLIELFELC